MGAAMPVTCITITWEDDDGVEHVTDVPACWEICSDCRGSGGSSAHLGAFSAEDWAAEDDDFRTDYLAGVYDQPCRGCGGSGKVQVPDHSAKLTDEQRHALTWRDDVRRADAEVAAESAHERRQLGSC